MTKLERICDAIVGGIESGALREGDQLPSEAQLAEHHRVSVGTVQKALTRLAHSGLVSREHGRGTFVSGRRLAPTDVRYLRFHDAEGNELAHDVRVRSVRRVASRGPWADFLGARDLIRIVRLLGVGRRLQLYSEFWLREDDFVRLGGVDRHTLEANLRELLGKRLALPTLRVDQWLRLVAPPAAAARALGLAPRTPALVIDIRGYTLRDQPLFWQRACAGPFDETLVIVR